MAFDRHPGLPYGKGSWPVRYGVAAVVVVLALLVQSLLVPLFGDGPDASPFMTFFAAVMLGAYLGGLGPGLFATGLSAGLVWYFMFSPQYSLELVTFGQGLRLIMFALEGAIISGLVEAMRSARRRAESSASQAEADRRRLRRSEERFRATFEQAAVGVAHVSTGGRILRANDKLCEILGRSREELQDLYLQDLSYPEDHEADVEQARRLLAGEAGSYSIEKRYVGGDGTTVWTNLSVSLVRGPSGPEYFIGAIEDVTKRKRVEEARRFLVEAGEALSSSLDYRTTLAGVARLAVPALADWCAVDVVGDGGALERLVVVHQDPRKVRLARELGEAYPPDPGAPRGTPQVVRTGRPELYTEITDDMLRAAAVDEEHLRILRELGFTSLIVVPMLARGRTLGAITFVSAESGRRYGEDDLGIAEELARRAATAVDNARLYEEARTELAERKRAEEELRASRDQLEIIMRGVADGVTAQDPYGRLVYANDAAARLSGYPSARSFVEAPQGEALERFEILDESGRPFPVEDLPGRRALRGEEGAGAVLRFREKETGAERWSAVEATPVFDETGRVIVAVNIFRDITERKRAEGVLREVREAERSRMARDLHDGPLQDLSYALAEMDIVRMYPEDAQAGERLERAIDALRTASRGLRAAVNDLRLAGERERPLPRLVESLVERSRGMAPDVEVDLVVEDGVPSAPVGDAGTDLLRVLQEALTNARRHSGAHRVRVALKPEGEDLVATVSDDGRGFAPETPAGIGLRSMRERAEALGGRLDVKSEPGEGTTVRLRVPVRRFAQRSGPWPG